MSRASISRARCEVAQFPGGHSNLTYLVRFGDAELVLRRPPLGPVPPKAHDMAREFRWLAAIHPVFPLAPRPYLLCEDATIIGSIFYVMERRRGIVVRHEEPPALAISRRLRRRVSEALVDTLADLHAIDVVAARLGRPGKAGGLRRTPGPRVDRALAPVEDRATCRRWTQLAAVARRPPAAGSGRPAIVHGDFKLDNVLLDPIDLGAHRRRVRLGDERARRSAGGPGDPPRVLGAHRAAVAARRADHGDRIDPAGSRATRSSSATPRGPAATCRRIAFYEMFALFKIAVVIQQIFYRYRAGRPTTRGSRRSAIAWSICARQAHALAAKASNV